MQLLPGVDDDNSLRTVEDIDELNTVFTKLFSTKNSKSKSKKVDEKKKKVIQVDAQEVASNDHDPSSVFVDLLLSSLSRLNGMNQRLLRDVIKSIFKTVSSVLSATAISTMLGAITQKHNLDKEKKVMMNLSP